MAGVYIHIPFCKQACYYCNFHFSTSKFLIKPLIEAICTEAALRKQYLQEPVQTLYIGGGTPSLLETELLEKIINAVQKNFSCNSLLECTLEANPDDVSSAQLKAWKHLGIQRLSIGVQSVFDKELNNMNRSHSAAQAINSIKLALEAGFTNISVDLIYGSSTLSNEEWIETLQQIFSYHVPHLSCYALTVEPKTALAHFIHNKKIPNVNAERQAQQFELLVQLTQQAGYEQYEISNFAKPGFYSKHNSSYWQQKPYIGLGPSAHSYNQFSRQWNVANNTLYIQSIQQHKTVPFEIEYLTPVQQVNEYIMTALRTAEGLSVNHIALHWNNELAKKIIYDAQPWIKSNHIEYTNNQLRLTGKGKLFADGIAAALFRETF